MHFFHKSEIYYNVSHKNKLKNAPITTKQLIHNNLEAFNARTQFYKKYIIRENLPFFKCLEFITFKLTKIELLKPN